MLEGRSFQRKKESPSRLTLSMLSLVVVVLISHRKRERKWMDRRMVSKVSNSFLREDKQGIRARLQLQRQQQRQKKQTKYSVIYIATLFCIYHLAMNPSSSSGSSPMESIHPFLLSDNDVMIALMAIVVDVTFI